MAIIFDEVTADVQSPPTNAPVAPQPAEGVPGKVDGNALQRELQRQSERQARLKAD